MNRTRNPECGMRNLDRGRLNSQATMEYTKYTKDSTEGGAKPHVSRAARSWSAATDRRGVAALGSRATGRAVSPQALVARPTQSGNCAELHRRSPGRSRGRGAHRSFIADKRS